MRLREKLLCFDSQSLMADTGILATVLPFAREIKRRRNHPGTKYVPDSHPQRNQLAFHKSEAMVRLVFGGNQTGKSCCVAEEIKWWLEENHPYQKTPAKPYIYVVSAEYRTIYEGVYKHLKNFLCEWKIKRRGNNLPNYDMPSWIEMVGGGRVVFLSGEGGEGARQKSQAAAVDLVAVDEEVSRMVWEELQPRRLARGGRAIISATLMRSEDWILDLEDKAMTGDPDTHLVRFDAKIAVEAGHADKRVYAEIESTHADDDLAIRLRGHSRRNQGLVYAEFSARHVVAPFPIPKTWTRYCAIDPGWRTCAVLWAAVAPDGKYVIYRELYLHEAHYQSTADKIFAAEGYVREPKSNTWLWHEGKTERVEIHWIDPSAFGHHETGELRMGGLFASLGLACAPARNDVEAGIEMCRGALLKDMDGVPRVRVFSSCTSFLMELRAYRRQKDTRDTGKPERNAKPVKRRDHLMDAWKYLELGGLNYQAELTGRDAARRSLDLERIPYPEATSTLQQMLNEEWQKIMERQHGQNVQVAHVGGIGTEY